MLNCALYAVATAVALVIEGICIFAAANNPLAGWLRPGIVVLGCQILLTLVFLQGYRLGDFKRKEG